MSQLPEGLIVRRPVPADAQATLELMVACDVAEFGEPDSSLEDLVDEWADINLEQDAWLVYTADNQLVGYAAVFGGARFSFDVYTLPLPDKVDLNIYLLQQCESRARAQLADMPATGSVTAMTIMSHTNTAGRQAAEAAGFTPHNYHCRMQIELDAPPPAPAWPEGTTLRTIVPGQDDRRVYDFIQAVFDWPGRVPHPFEQWHDFMMRPDHFQRDLWFLLFHQDELIGAALCFDYPQHGWVRQLGVALEWRRQGIGSALLQHVFGVFYRRGHTRVALGVNSANPQAFQFYERVGMQRARQYDEYHKTLILA